MKNNGFTVLFLLLIMLTGSCSFNRGRRIGKEATRFLKNEVIARDGMTNPENFVDHRRAVTRLSQIAGALASAYKITGDEKYVKQAFTHFRAWVSDTATMMNPSLLYAQAIKGRYTGRGVGIIDTIQLMEVAQAIRIMEKAGCVDKQLLTAVKSWFTGYLEWLMTHQYSIDEMNAKNNHVL